MAMGAIIMSDMTVRQNVVDELQYEPSVNAAHIGVAANGGVITLTGHVDSYAEKLQAVKAARRVKGVRAIADDIVVRHAFDKKTADDEIAGRALAILSWDAMVPAKAISVVVRDGWITLSGDVDWNFQRRAAESDIRKLSGIRGVHNNINVKPRLEAYDIKTKIEEALKRRAEQEGRGIRVSVEGGDHVILEGTVDSWDERFAIENVAWAAPGVKSVDTRLTIA
jgi:osmotically-inducible protein OsmY